MKFSIFNDQMLLTVMILLNYFLKITTFSKTLLYLLGADVIRFFVKINVRTLKVYKNR